jgi:hypothetical protein
MTSAISLEVIPIAMRSFLEPLGMHVLRGGWGVALCSGRLAVWFRCADRRRFGGLGSRFFGWSWSVIVTDSFKLAFVSRWR